jgi:hypothetical protein
VCRAARGVGLLRGRGGGVDSFLADDRVRDYLRAGAYVIADFADAVDALECERRVAVARGEMQ